MSNHFIEISFFKFHSDFIWAEGKDHFKWGETKTIEKRQPSAMLDPIDQLSRFLAPFFLLFSVRLILSSTTKKKTQRIEDYYFCYS